MCVSVHVFVYLEEEAEEAEDDLGSMVGSAYRPASQSRQVSMWLSPWEDLTELSLFAYIEFNYVHVSIQNYIIFALKNKHKNWKIKQRD